ncbi:MAG: radical SAM protein [Desulfobacula sp.]|nr:radical SAM protein [Desulfobacula sp.]
MRYRHIFGPIPSRRLGISLGIDLVTHKTCSMDCVYCECGKTTELTLEPKEYVSYEDVVKELDDYLEHHPDPDYITFSGSGEPTLNTCLGHVIDHIRSRRPHIKVAVLTNSTLILNPSVWQALLKADLVLPSLDAVSKKAFAKINRPHKGIDAQEVAKGIEAFAKAFKGKIWLEVLILPGLNDRVSDLAELKDAIHRIHPDRLQINTLDRPGTLTHIKPASRSDLERVAEILDFPDTEIIARVGMDIQARAKRDDIRAVIIDAIHRRPCTKEDLLKILGVEREEIDACINLLLQEKLIVGKIEERGIFFQTVKEPT